MATFAYARVSTGQQTVENQRLEIESAGYVIDYWFADEGVSGKVPAQQRPQFCKLVDRIREGETLVVCKLDRLGRDSVDVLSTLRDLEARQVRVIVLQLGTTDLTSPAGKLLVTMLAAVSEMERDLLIERTQAGLATARAKGARFGRPSKLTDKQRADIANRIGHDGITVSGLAREFGVSRATILTCKAALTESE